MLTGTDGTDHLIELGHQPRFREYVAEVWSRRDFALRVPLNDLRTQNMDTVLGQLWHILNPAINIAVYWLIFGTILGVDRGVPNFLGFLVIGITLIQLGTRIMGDTVGAIARDEGLIRSVQFPRAILPISAVITQMIAFVPAAVVMLVALLLTGESPSWKWLLFPVMIVGFMFLNLGVALISARAGYSVRDLTQVVPHVSRVLFYGSGVLFPLDRFDRTKDIIDLFVINPFFVVVTAFRSILIGYEARPIVWWAFIGYCIVLPIFGLWFFMRAEHKYGS